MLLLFLVYGGVPVQAEEEPPQVEVADPYIELHTGAGRGYPIFYVATRGETIAILYRKTEWFKVRLPSGKEGWVHRNQMLQTLQPSGEKLVIREETFEDFIRRRWELGFLAGDFEGASLINVYGTYHFTENISTDIYLTRVLGNFSSSTLLGANLTHQPFPDWQFSPYFSLGTGIIDTKPKGTLVGTLDRRDNYANVGLGMRVYLTRHIFLRFEYRNYKIFASRDDDEEIDEWKGGIAFFF